MGSAALIRRSRPGAWGNRRHPVRRASQTWWDRAELPKSQAARVRAVEAGGGEDAREKEVEEEGAADGDEGGDGDATKTNDQGRDARGGR